VKNAAITALLFATPFGFGAEPGGLRPRVDHTRYPVAVFNEFVAIAAERVGPEKTRRLLGSELDDAYLVVEVSIYPRGRSTIDVKPGEFFLRVNRTREIVQSSMPGTVVGESRSRALPETIAHKPVAGYLYFQVPEKRSGNYEYELEYKGQGHWMIIPLQAASAK
jgi:hypothetical protein